MKNCLLLICLWIPVSLWSQPDWKKITTIDDVCKAYPDKIAFIFQNLNLDYPGLDKVRQAYSKRDIPLACAKLLDYYRTSKSAKMLPGKRTAGMRENEAAADAVLQDVFTFQGITGKVPRLNDGRLKWDHAGPENDIEWAWALNRHYPVGTLLDAWEETGNKKYLPYIDNFIKDWIISSWPYPGVKSSTAMWRGLEVSFRVKVWKEVFFGLMQTGSISPATQLLILSSLPDHAHYARNFHAQNNWLTMEISGLATVAAYWPEYKSSPEWLKYTINTMVASMKDQVYPDGVQTELTSSYHFVALSNFSQYLRICREAGIDLPEYYTKTLGNMWNYLAMTMRPDGYGILNNDADLMNNRKNVLNASGEYHREDWKYIAENGKSGLKPESGPSVVFPWAGQMVSRSGYDQDAQWSFFDFGPWGSGHQHNDKLHLSVVAYGRDLLVDAGRFAYRGAIADKFRKYATGSQGHNVLLIDGKGQSPGPKLAEKPLTNEDFKVTGDYDYASGSFDMFTGIEGSCKHTRSLLYVRGKYWVVVDRITTDRPRKIEALWHWHPGNVVKQGSNGVVFTQNDRGNLKIIPVGKTNWNVNLVKGREKPDIQGWYSPVYNTFEPDVATIYSTENEKDNTFVWLLAPSEKEAPDLKAGIVSQNSEGIKLKVLSPGKGEWNMNIPFSGSRGAFMSYSVSSQEPDIFKTSESFTPELQQLHRNVIKGFLAEPDKTNDAIKYAIGLGAGDSWNDIDYTNMDRGGWEPAAHLSRVLTMAQAYNTPGSCVYQDRIFSGKIHQALNFWLKKDLICPNWWYPEIGVPQILNPIMLLMDRELTPEQREKGIKILQRAKMGMTGQNKVWLAGNVLLTSLLLRDAETIGKASKTIQEELVVSLKEGIQPDWSYHQHGPQLQFGNYGLAYVNDMIRWIALLRNTPFHFDESKVTILRNYMLEGQQWVTWKNRYDISSCGRQVFPRAQESKASSISRNFLRMATVDTAFAGDYLKADQYRNLSGNRFFWRSDYQIQRTAVYFFSVKMSSERTIGAETVNSENIRGFYMGDGATFLYQTTKEYEDIFPFWDWRKIPGVTAHQDKDTLNSLAAGNPRNQSSYTGGVSDGQNGIAAMKYNRRGLMANKSWFMFRDRVICLGSDITSSTGVQVTTSVNQSFLHGDVEVKTRSGLSNAKETEEISNPGWLLHDSVGYYFPDGGKLHLEAREKEGSWNRAVARFSEEKLKAKIFSLWLDHGTNPSGQTYSYVLVPRADRKVMEMMDKKFSFHILNLKTRQEVVAKDGLIGGVVFYEAGRSDIFGGIEADQPCIVLVKKEGKGIQLSVADPTQKLAEINLRIGKKAVLRTIVLPQGGEAGKSVSVVL